MYPVPVEVVWSTDPVIVVFVVSISSIWLRTGTMSFELGIAVILNLVDVAPSTLPTLVILSGFICTIPCN